MDASRGPLGERTLVEDRPESGKGQRRIRPDRAEGLGRLSQRGSAAFTANLPSAERRRADQDERLMYKRGAPTIWCFRVPEPASNAGPARPITDGRQILRQIVGSCMAPRSVILLVAKIALPVLIALLWGCRRYLAQRPTPSRKDEIAFERGYEVLEPQSSQPDYVRGAGDVILRYHDWGWFALLLAGIAIGIFAVKDPVVRTISGITGVVLGTIVAGWIYRRRTRGKRLGS